VACGRSHCSALIVRMIGSGPGIAPSGSCTFVLPRLSHARHLFKHFYKSKLEYITFNTAIRTSSDISMLAYTRIKVKVTREIRTDEKTTDNFNRN
jgi:hypothetical protein